VAEFALAMMKSAVGLPMLPLASAVPFVAALAVCALATVMALPVVCWRY
jgi:hypothetical protein